LASSHVADDDAVDRPLLTEMAEKMRQARGSSFTDRPEAPPAPPPAPPRPAPQHEPGGRDPSPGPDPLQVSLRIDSLERRLFELRTALEDATAQAAGPAPAAAAAVGAAGDAAAWIAFAAAAMSEYDDASAQAEAADQLLAEFRARRARGGVLSDEA
jgi:hypothetical protein